MPCTTGKIFIQVKITVSDDVESRALLIVDHHRQSILKFLAKADVEHARVERAPPHAYVEPARPGKRARNGTWKDQIGGSGEHRLLRAALYFCWTSNRCARESIARAKYRDPARFECLDGLQPPLLRDRRRARAKCADSNLAADGFPLQPIQHGAQDRSTERRIEIEHGKIGRA